MTDQSCGSTIICELMLRSLPFTNAADGELELIRACRCVSVGWSRVVLAMVGDPSTTVAQICDWRCSVSVTVHVLYTVRDLARRGVCSTPTAAFITAQLAENAEMYSVMLPTQFYSGDVYVIEAANLCLVVRHPAYAAHHMVVFRCEGEYPRRRTTYYTSGAEQRCLGLVRLTEVLFADGPLRATVLTQASKWLEERPRRVRDFWAC